MNDKLVVCAFHQYAKKTRCVAYCKRHRCYLTRTQLNNMHCLQKQCKYLKKDTEHQFWIEKEKRKKKQQ